MQGELKEMYGGAFKKEKSWFRVIEERLQYCGIRGYSIHVGLEQVRHTLSEGKKNNVRGTAVRRPCKVRGFSAKRNERCTTALVLVQDGIYILSVLYFPFFTLTYGQNLVKTNQLRTCYATNIRLYW